MALADRLIEQFDRALRTLASVPRAQSENPAAGLPEEELTPQEASHAAGLMRVNHTGEICAQALYEGQALTAKDERTRAALLEAAAEEADHLAWCTQRLEQLESKPSVLNPGFYAASFAMGAFTGLLGDRVSLGFVEATEEQVCEHLQDHLAVVNPTIRQHAPPEDMQRRQFAEYDELGSLAVERVVDEAEAAFAVGEDLPKADGVPV